MIRLQRLQRRLLGSRLLRLVGTALGLLLLVRAVDLHRAAASLRDANVRCLAAGVGLTALVILTTAMQWGVVLRQRRRFGWVQIGSWHLQSLFFASIVPAGVGGDAMRCAAAGPQAGTGATLATLAASRLSGTLGMALWGVAGAIALHATVGPVVLAAAAVFAALMLLSGAGALVADRIVHRAYRSRHLRSRDLPRRLGPFVSGLAGLRRRPRVVLACIASGAASWGLNLLALSFFAHAIGADVAWTVFAVAVPVSLVTTLVPFSINGMGLREGVLVGMLAHSGMATSSAVAVSLIVDLQMIPFALIGAAILLARRSAAVGRDLRGPYRTIGDSTA